MKRKPKFPPLVPESDVDLSTLRHYISAETEPSIRRKLGGMVCALAAAEWRDRVKRINESQESIRDSLVAGQNAYLWDAFRRENCK